MGDFIARIFDNRDSVEWIMSRKFAILEEKLQKQVEVAGFGSGLLIKSDGELHKTV